MFSGIIESQSRVLAAAQEDRVVRLKVEKPSSFNDLNLGDSISCNGICLTVEAFNSEMMQFALGAETLQVTGWSAASLLGRSLNLERSLRFGDRIHGHMVSGHVDGLGEIALLDQHGGSLLMTIQIPDQLRPLLWKKGSWAVNGVSLTINSVDKSGVSVCLIPETLKRTNLAELRLGDRVTVEVDMMARGILHAIQEVSLGERK